MFERSKTQKSDRSKERGSALVYILIAIALLAALTVTFMEPSSQQTSSQNSFRMVTDVKSQVDVIRSALQECVLLYREGDTTIDISSPGGGDPDARRNLPIKPNSTHYASATIGPTSGRLVKDVRCPGNPGGGDINHVKVFGGASGKFLPPVPDLFEDWQYYNGIDGIFFWLQTDKSDAFINTALEKLDDEFGECEADVVTGAVNLDSTGEVTCASGYTCFRVRFTINNATAEYNGDSDGEEASCP